MVETILDEHKVFFETVAEYKKKQLSQKQRGLNDYNILTAVLKPHDEVRLHSRMVHSLLDVDGLHYQGSLFLDLFLDSLGVADFNIDVKNCRVYTEYEGIDIYVTDGIKHIVLENKIYAGDQKGQVYRYLEKVCDKGEDCQNVLLIFLSLDGRDPSDYSLSRYSVKGGYVNDSAGEKKALYKPISYKREILSWLAKCQHEVGNITNLNEAIKQYSDTVKKVNDMYESKVVSLKDLVVKDQETYLMAKEVSEALSLARKDIVMKFFEEVNSLLVDRLGDEWVVGVEGDLSKKYHFPFRVRRKTWGSEGLIFAHEFDGNDFHSGGFGIVKTVNSINMKDLRLNFRDAISRIDNISNANAWWLHSEYSLNNEKIPDFVECILDFNEKEEAVRTYVDDAMKMVKVFELESSFISDINQFLSDKS